MTPNAYQAVAPSVFLHQMFRAKSARHGSVIRRSVHDVERILGRDAFRAELERRGYRAIENGGQFIILCNDDPLQVFC